MKIFTYIKDDSSRVSKKNFRELNGVPMWEYCLSKFGDYPVYVDTDSEHIISSVSKYENTIAYKRDPICIDMENDKNNKESPALLMTQRFVEQYTQPEDNIVVTHVTSPFLSVDTLQDAIEYLDKGYDYVHSVSKIQDFAWDRKYNPVNFDPSIVQRTQDIPPFYFSLGAFFCFKAHTFTKNKSRIGENTFYYELNRIESIDIDTEDDMILAEMVSRGMNNEYN